MLDWVQRTLESPELGVAAIPAMLLLGLASATTNCCTPAVLTAMAGYSGAGDLRDRKEALYAGVCFLAGTIAALTILGSIVAYVGQLASQELGRAFQAVAGLVAILFGLAILDLLPARLPKINLKPRALPSGRAGAAGFGFVVGGASVACMLGCSPLLAVPTSVAALKGQTLFGALMLTAFAIGYSVPLALMLVGLRTGLGAFGANSQRFVMWVRTIAGLILILAGFYMLWTLAGK